jgi:hypothetical protein
MKLTDEGYLRSEQIQREVAQADIEIKATGHALTLPTPPSKPNSRR